MLQSACPSRKRTGKTPRQIRYVRYREWALKIMKFHPEDSLKYYNYLEEVLNYIRALGTKRHKGQNFRGFVHSFAERIS